MVRSTYTPLLSEVLRKVHNAKTKSKKIEILKEHDCDALRMVIKSSFDPKIEWVIPNGEVPFTANEAEEGTEHTVLRKEAKKLFNFIKGGNDRIAGFKRKNMFIQMLEGLHEDEAKVLIHAKDKELHKVYKGLSHEVVKTAFNWDDNYVKKT